MLTIPRKTLNRRYQWLCRWCAKAAKEAGILSLIRGLRNAPPGVFKIKSPVSEFPVSVLAILAPARKIPPHPSPPPRWGEGWGGGR